MSDPNVAPTQPEAHSDRARNALRRHARRIRGVLLPVATLSLALTVMFPAAAQAAVPSLIQNEIVAQATRHASGTGACPSDLGAAGFSFYNGSTTYRSCLNGQANGAWCADFAGWVWSSADPGIVVYGLNYWASSFKSYGQTHGTYIKGGTGTPHKGDAVVFFSQHQDSTGKWINDGIAHVAIVTAVDTSYSPAHVTSWGGNQGNTVNAYTNYSSQYGTKIGGVWVDGFVSPVVVGQCYGGGPC